MIRKSQIVAALAAVGTLTCGVAAYGQALPRATDVFAPYGSSGNWNVFVNTTRGNCFAERRDEAAVLQMGITKPPVFGYMGVFTQAPTDLQSGRVEKITIEMRGRTFIGEVTEAAGNIRGGFSGGYVVSQDAGFIEEVAGASTMKVTVEGREPMEISLAGTARAIDAVRACNEAQSG